MIYLNLILFKSIFKALGLGKEFAILSRSNINKGDLPSIVSFSQWTLLVQRIIKITKRNRNVQLQNKSKVSSRNKNNNRLQSSVNQSSPSSSLPSDNSDDSLLMSCECKDEVSSGQGGDGGGRRSVSVPTRRKSRNESGYRESNHRIEHVSVDGNQDYAYDTGVSPYYTWPAHEIERENQQAEHFNNLNMEEIAKNNGSKVKSETRHAGRGGVTRPPPHTRSKSHYDTRPTDTRVQIAVDKRNWIKSFQAGESKALEVVGGERLKQFVEKGIRRSVLAEPGGGDTKKFVGTDNEEYRHGHGGGHGHGHGLRESKLERKDPSSGSAAIAIADAFLSGRVARDLLGDGSAAADDDNYSLSNSVLKNEPSRNGFFATIQPNNMKYLTSEDVKVSANGYKKGVSYHRDVEGEGEDESISNSDVQKINSYININGRDGAWRTTKGGWVADFGPAHTHPLGLKT